MLCAICVIITRLVNADTGTHNNDVSIIDIIYFSFLKSKCKNFTPPINVFLYYYYYCKILPSGDQKKGNCNLYKGFCEGKRGSNCYF